MPEKLVKPEVLYHGSPHDNVEELEPRREHVRDPEEGPVLFATQDIALATVFMFRSKGGNGSGKHGDIPFVYIAEPREKFINRDNGGHIYVLPSKSFYSNPNKGLGIYEWTSKEKVKPIRKIEYASVLDAMIENGVQVYFIDQTTYENMAKSSDHGWSILISLESENQKRGVNVRKLQ